MAKSNKKIIYDNLDNAKNYFYSYYIQFQNTIHNYLFSYIFMFFPIFSVNIVFARPHFAQANQPLSNFL